MKLYVGIQHFHTASCISGVMQFLIHGMQIFHAAVSEFLGIAL